MLTRLSLPTPDLTDAGIPATFVKSHPKLVLAPNKYLSMFSGDVETKDLKTLKEVCIRTNLT